MKIDSSPSTPRFPSLAMERNDRTFRRTRGQKVILDANLAALYGVTTKAFNQAAKRNRDWFPSDFMFRLMPEEKTEVVTKCDHLRQLKFSPLLPLAFTEHGTTMPASVLNSPRAIAVSVYVVRAFIRLREAIAQVFDAIQELMQPAPAPLKRRIGFFISEE